MQVHANLFAFRDSHSERVHKRAARLKRIMEEDEEDSKGYYRSLPPAFHQRVILNAAIIGQDSLCVSGSQEFAKGRRTVLV